jgi:hypothetical protein
MYQVFIRIIIPTSHPSYLSHYQLILGLALTGATNRATIIPRSKASQIPYGSGVQLSAIPSSDSVSVKDSSSSLKVIFTSPDDVHGSDVSSFLLEWWDTPSSPEILNIQLYSSDPFYGTFRLSYNGYQTDYIPYNASESIVQAAIENLFDIRDAKVVKTPLGNGYIGNNWQVSLTSTYPTVYNQMLSLDYNGIASLTNAAILGNVVTVQAAVLPHGYQSTLIPAQPGIKSYQFVISGLVTGVPYYVQVSSLNAEGLSHVQTSTPAAVAPPLQNPSEPLDVYLVTYSANSLKVLWMYPDSDGGDIVNSYKIEWDTSAGFNSSKGSPLGSYHSVTTSATDCSLSHCYYVISALSKGTNYFVRIFALNSNGYSALPGVPIGISETPKTQPSRPSKVTVIPVAADTVQLTILPPTDNGGAPISQYKVEWDVVSAEAYDSILTSPALSLLYFPYAVQKIQTSAAAYDLSGFFTIQFGGFTTIPLSVDSPAEQVQAALKATPAIGDVIVTRDETPSTHGVKWIITFLNSEWWNGAAYFDVPLLTVSNNNGATASSTVSVTVGSSFNGTSASITVTPLVTAMAGFEQQLIQVQVLNGSLYGKFSLSFLGYTTTWIPVSATELEIEVALNALSNIGKVFVRRRDYFNPGQSMQLLLVFIENLGDIDTVVMDSSYLFSTDGSASVSTFYDDVVVGSIPLMESRYHGQEIITVDPTNGKLPLQLNVSGLFQGLSYHMRAYPWNGVGNLYGLSLGCTPAVVVPSAAPELVSEVILQPSSDSSIDVSWAPPAENGGTQIVSYMVDVVVAPDVTEVQVISISSATAVFSGTFCLSYQGFSTGQLPYDASATRMEAALESIPNVGNVIVTQSLMSGTSYGISWTVQFLDNVGDMQSLKVSCNKLIGTSVSIALTTKVTGDTPSFNAASVINSSAVTRTSSIQSITVTSSSTDLNGHFWVSCSGEISQAIDVYSSATDMKRILEAMLTIRTVNVVAIDQKLDSAAPNTHYGRIWMITFLDSHYQSLLVTTNGGAADVSAVGGQLLGSKTRVVVSRVAPESQPTTVDITGLISGTKYVAKVTAVNYGFSNAGTITALSTAPKLLVPQPPSNVYMLTLSASQLAVWWTAPSQNGGSNITGYEVKWDSSYSFGTNTNYMFVSNATSFVIPHLSNGSTYVVGVSAYNSVGYSTAVIAQVHQDYTVTVSPAPQTIVTLSSQYPSSPVDVTLTVVSNSELGILWNAPAYDGGSIVVSYLIEWDTSPYFVRAGTTSYFVSVPASNLSFSGKWQYLYQISNLQSIPTYVRVSAVNGLSQSVATPAWPLNATACDTMPMHCSATPADQLLFLPVNPYTQLSLQQVANRLQVSWQQPTSDFFGFSTVSAGNHTPNLASKYRIEWSTLETFYNSSYYDVLMMTGDNTTLDCAISCSITVGEEVQSVSIISNNGEDLTAGSFALVYTGNQRLNVLMQTRSGSTLISILDANVSIPNKNDFLRIQGVIYQIDSAYTLLNISLTTPFIGGFSDVISGYYIPYPVDTLSFNSTAADVTAHLQNQLIPLSSPGQFFNFSNIFSVTVQRVPLGRNFLITFTGEMFYDNIENLMVLTGANTTYNVVGLVPFGTMQVPTFARTNVTVNKIIQAGVLTPGVPLFVRILAINGIGIGPALRSAVSADGNKHGALAPRSRPGLPVNPLVYSAPNSNGSELKVTWAMGESFGSEISQYTIEWIQAPFITWTGFNSIILTPSVLGSNNPFSWNIPVTMGQTYSVRVRQSNEQGASPPVWFQKISTGPYYTNSLVMKSDLHDGSQVCLPECFDGLDECSEASTVLILARALPGYPSLIVPLSSQQVAAPAFTKSSVMVYFSEPTPNGDSIGKYRVEWDEEITFTSPVKASFVTSNTYYNIIGLAMGQTYYIRVFAHSSIGYGAPSEPQTFIPMQQPDAPSKPRLKVAENAIDLVTYARSVNVSWSYPSISGLDLVGDGGDAVNSYLVEWSRIPFSSIIPNVQSIAITSLSLNVTTAFSLRFNASSSVSIIPYAVSGFIPVNASAADVKVILQNMPNIGEVQVSQSLSGSTTTFKVTFSEAIDVPTFVLGTTSADWSTSGSSVVLALVQSASFVGSFYGFKRVTAAPGAFAQNYLIPNLLPGHTYYTRISAGNSLGFGPRRLTAPTFLTVPVTQPTQLTQADGQWGNPIIYATSDTSVLFKVGPSAFDGGSLVSQFTVEWDTASTFDSNADNSKSPVGQMLVPAYTILCSACVTSIAFPTSASSNESIVSYSGNIDSIRLLQTGTRVIILTTDDSIPYTFTVGETSGTLTYFALSDTALRQAPFNSSVYGAADLYLLGAEFEVSGLTPGFQYFFRVSAENSIGICPPYIASCGSFVPTSPPSLVMNAFPEAPANMNASTASATSATVTWTRPLSIGSNIISYRVDAFTKSVAASANYFSFFGDSEIQKLSTSASNVTGGTFTVAFNAFTSLLPGSVSGSLQSYFFQTVIDLSSYLYPGDQIKVAGYTYTIASFKTRSESGFYVTTPVRGPAGTVGVVFAPLYARPTTVPIAYNVEATHLRDILERTPGFGQVWVDRKVSGYGYDWIITFLTDVGDIPLIVTNANGLLGLIPTIATNTAHNGTAPDSYMTTTISATSGINYFATFPILNTGTTYYFRVLATNSVGDGAFTSIVSAIPAAAPGAPSSLTIASESGSSILATYTEDASSNGSPIRSYALSIQSSLSALSGSQKLVYSFSVALSNRIQRVTTAAHTLPFLPGSTFSLAIGSFYGVYNSYIGQNSTYPGNFDAADRATKVTRSSTDQSVNHPFIEAVPGEFIQIAGQEFRVCLNQDIAFVALYGSLDTNTIPLCAVDNPWVQATIDAGFLSNVLRDIPVYRLDTFLGQIIDPSQGSATVFISYSDGITPDPSASTLAIGDYVSIGHPTQGEIFRVLSNINSVISLGTVNNPIISTSLSLVSAQVDTLVYIPCDHLTCTFFIAIHLRGAKYQFRVSWSNA